MDDDTEHFLAYSTKLAKTSFKHRFILPRLLSNRSRDYDSLHKWNLAESFLEREVRENLCLIFTQFSSPVKLSPGQFCHLLKSSEFDVDRPNLSDFGYGQGSGTILVNLARALQTDKIWAYDQNKKANQSAAKRGIQIEDGSFRSGLKHFLETCETGLKVSFKAIIK